MNQAIKQHEKNTTNTAIRKLLEAVYIGIWGVVIWCSIGFLAYWLNLTKLSPVHISKPFMNPDYIWKWEGLLFSLTLWIILSLIFSILYVFLFARFYTPWIGILLGAALWYILLGWRKLDMNTFSSTLSLFILYGAFVGYSLSIEFSSLEKK